ncbi:endo alpha-1,4 polygalactosaminidase [Marinobacter fuscus]|uniref:Endo alpha-1,4 polygalactosaminidase n=2 Tax=Marinobacter fuscus TaxID=2109942 RepID=A0A2T1K5B5_9GAMM|nr:endo alpha-1,4 polygalactosaminidase [Marinobacter fuscus]
MSLFGGCGGNGNSLNGNENGLDPDVAPITEGNWYRPGVFVTWQWQLSGNINTSYAVEIYDIDLFSASSEIIQKIQSSGKKVICYFSAGTYEEYRDDKDKFLPEDLGNTVGGWEKERWLDVRSPNVHRVMESRLDLAKEKGCDGVEPDNVDGHINKTGFKLTAADQLAYNKFIANESHKRELSVGLKNDLSQVNELLDYYDFAVNEECFQLGECDALLPFISDDKPVLNAEYLRKYVENKSEREALCTESINNLFSTLVLPLKLDDEFRFSCL